MQTLELSRDEQQENLLEQMFQERKELADDVQALQMEIAALEERYKSIDRRDMERLEKLEKDLKK